MQMDRKFWRHPGVWKMPQHMGKDVYLPTPDLFVAVTNFVLIQVFFTLMYWEGLAVPGADNFSIPLALCAFFQSIITADCAGFLLANQSTKSPAGVTSFIRSFNNDTGWSAIVIRPVINAVVAPRLQSFAKAVRDVKSDNG